MSTAEFSESSYAFALTSDLASGRYGTVVGAPEFPTQRQEGAQGGGYDAKIPYRAVPVFLQFKVPQVMRRSSKFRPKGFGLPYYRIALRTKRPNQHQLLLDLESERKIVLYAAPRFHQSQQLNQYYMAASVATNSAFFKPGRIGKLDEQDHHIAYDLTSESAWCYSDPTQIEGTISAEETLTHIQNAVMKAQERSPERFVEDLGRSVLKTINRFGADEDEFAATAPTIPIGRDGEVIDDVPDEPFQPIREIVGGFPQIAALTRFYLGCELLIFGPAEAKSV